MFFSLEGIDGVGKSTQQQRLCDWLRQQGYEVVACRDPGSTAAGEAIRALLLDCGTQLVRRAEMFLYMAARAQMVEEVIRPALAAGAVVVSDRFLLSNVVYQGHAGGLPVRRLWSIGHYATGGVEPELTLVLDLDPEAATLRMQRPLDRMELQGDAYRRRLREGFLKEAARLGQRAAVIDALGTIDEVQQRIRDAVQRVLAKR
jgi:dTMP kinase